MKTAKYWIENLNLLPHPEGGYFKETYRCKESIEHNSIDSRFNGKRNFSTAIYFLLEKGQKSVFHRIKSDEIWHFHDGGKLAIHIIGADGNLITHILGLDFGSGANPQIVVPAGCWFAAEPLGSYTLVGCTVSPGFDFNDFEMAEQTRLISDYPDLKDIINRFT